MKFEVERKSFLKKIRKVIFIIIISILCIPMFIISSIFWWNVFHEPVHYGYLISRYSDSVWESPETGITVEFHDDEINVYLMYQNKETKMALGEMGSSECFGVVYNVYDEETNEGESFPVISQFDIKMSKEKMVWKNILYGEETIYNGYDKITFVRVE